MNREEFKKKVSVQWGALSKEHSMLRDVIKKAEKWEKHEYEIYGPPSANKKENHRRAIDATERAYAAGDIGGQSQQQKEGWLPNDREIFRMAWSYLFARAGWVVMAYIIMFGFLGLMFLAMWLMAT